MIYGCLSPAATWLTTVAFRQSLHTRLGSAIQFFLFETPKVLMLLVLIVFVVGIIRSFFTAEKTRQILAGRRLFDGQCPGRAAGHTHAVLLVFRRAAFYGLRAGRGAAGGHSFVSDRGPDGQRSRAGHALRACSAPKSPALYLVTGLRIAILAGWVIGLLKMEKHVEGWVYEMQAAQCCVEQESLTWVDRIEAGRAAVIEIVGKVWPYLLVGIAVGSGIHGYVPEGLMARFMGENVWWSVPAAVVIGIPMYSNAAGVIPIVQALLEKGAALGTVLAFMMAVIALSLPEVMILRKSSNRA